MCVVVQGEFVGLVKSEKEKRIMGVRVVDRRGFLIMCASILRSPHPTPTTVFYIIRVYVYIENTK
jgi:hypothetical protein